jgi:hypothetical protein
VSTVIELFNLTFCGFHFRRRKRLHNHSRECHPSHPLVSDLHQFSLQKDLQENPQFLVGDEVNNTGSLFHHSSKLSHSNTGHKSLTAVTALSRNGQTMTRCCGNLEAHFQRHYNNNGGSGVNNQANSLPNHYIPDQPAFPRLSEVRPRLSVPDRTVMELSERPPQLRPPTVVPPNAYPHIIIGGKPFYLIPSSGDEHSNNHVDGSFESYSYPQHMPIYEEIDGNSSCGGRFYEAASELECSSEQGEVGSVERLSHPVDSMQRSPRMFRSLFVAGDVTPHHRPVSSATSHSQNSSQQTNTSEVSSSSCSSTASTSNPNLSNQQQQQQQQHYVILDPGMEEGKKRQTSFSSLYENSLSKSSKSPKLSKSGIRLADGVERCRSPQSIYSARLANKSVSQCSSPNRSVYYYSDTLKRDNSLKQDNNKQSPIKEGDEVSPSDDSIEIELDNSFVKPVNTVIVLDDPKLSDKKKGTATLV